MSSVGDRGDSGSGGFTTQESATKNVGSVQTHASEQKGTGYDSSGHVSTAMGRQDIGYDPETGMASVDLTTGKTMPTAPQPSANAPLSGAADKRMFRGDLDPDGKHGGHDGTAQ